jgi:hypothetical protein
MFFRKDIEKLASKTSLLMDDFMSSYSFVVSDESGIEENSFKRVYVRGRRYIILSAGNYAVDYPWFWRLSIKLKANRIVGVDFEEWKKAKFGVDSEYLAKFRSETEDVLLKLKGELPLYAKVFLEETISEKEFELAIRDVWSHRDL